MFLDVDGHQTFCHTGGSPLSTRDGVVVLLHGAGNDHSVWRYQTRRLAQMGVAAVAPDLPAHGRSQGAARTSIQGWSSWLGQLLDALDSPSAILIGHSMGSLMSLQHAVDDPSRTQAIGLICTAPKMAVHPELLAAADKQEQLAVDLIVGWTHNAESRFGAHRQAGVWNTALTARLLEANLGVLGTDLHTVAAYDATDAATQVATSVAEGTVDALVMGGGADRMTLTKAGAEMARLLGAPYVPIGGYGHAVHYDAPVELNEVLLPWVAARTATAPPSRGHNAQPA